MRTRAELRTGVLACVRLRALVSVAGSEVHSGTGELPGAGARLSLTQGHASPLCQVASHRRLHAAALVCFGCAFYVGTHTRGECDLWRRGRVCPPPCPRAPARCAATRQCPELFSSPQCLHRLLPPPFSPLPTRCVISHTVHAGKPRARAPTRAALAPPHNASLTHAPCGLARRRARCRRSLRRRGQRCGSPRLATLRADRTRRRRA